MNDLEIRNEYNDQYRQTNIQFDTIGSMSPILWCVEYLDKQPNVYCDIRDNIIRRNRCLHINCAYK